MDNQIDILQQNLQVDYHYPGDRKKLTKAIKSLVESECRKAKDITISCYRNQTVIKKGKKKYWITLETGESVNLAELEDKK